MVKKKKTIGSLVEKFVNLI